MTAQVHTNYLCLWASLKGAGFIHQRINATMKSVTYLDNSVATEISHVEIEPAVLHLTGEKLHTTANGQDDHGFSIISLFDNSHLLSD
jgi:hypothetical protein